MNPDRCKHLWRTVRLIGLYSNLISRNFLVILLAQDCDDIERRTAG